MRFLHYTLPVLLWVGLIFVSSSLSWFGDPSLAGGDMFYLRKSWHLIEYAVLYGLLYRDMAQARVKGGEIWALILTFLFAVSDEYHQSLVPLRVGSALDVVIDTTGIILAWLMIGWRRISLSK